MENLEKALSWDDLAELYDSVHSGRPARTLPMDYVFEWVEEQKGFKVMDDGTIHKIIRMES